MLLLIEGGVAVELVLIPRMNIGLSHVLVVVNGHLKTEQCWFDSVAIISLS